MRELEIAGAAALASLAGGKGKAPHKGAACANCAAPLQGPFCHVCGQSADMHKRSLLRLIVEGVESVFHLDGRLARTLPDLFLRPGRLARDLIEGRVARHVPPFRLFLVALLIWVFAAEVATHRGAVEIVQVKDAKAALLQTPQGRVQSAAEIRVAAAKARDSALREAAADYDSDLKDPGEVKAKVEARYARAEGRIQARYAAAMTRAEDEDIAKGQVPSADLDMGLGGGSSWWRTQVRKATANPEYFLSVMFTWGHRVAFLLLPIVGFSLALVYAIKRRFFVYDHFLVAMTFLSFVFLANAPVFLLPKGWSDDWLAIVTLWTPVNLYQALRDAYGTGRWMAILRALIVWSTTVFWFGVLVIGLAVFVLTQI